MIITANKAIYFQRNYAHCFLVTLEMQRKQSGEKECKYFCIYPGIG